MTKLRPAVKVLALAAVIAFAASAARAQATRTWVSGNGNDADPCSRIAPCKTFAGAVSKTATGGEINVLDPGGFGAAVITKAVTIDGLGITGGNLASGLSGFTVNITTNLPTDKVILRNLEINGNNATSGTFHGIRFLDGAELTVENVTIQNFSGNGIEINQGQTSVTNIRNLSTDNLGGAGVRASTTSGQTIVVINDSRLRATSEGVHAVNNVRVALRDSTITKVTTGVRTSGANSIINADDLFVAFCTTGFQASASSSINVSDSIVTQNSTGVNANGGAVNSFGGNSLINNTSPGAFSSTTPKQ